MAEVKEVPIAVAENEEAAEEGSEEGSAEDDEEEESDDDDADDATDNSGEDAATGVSFDDDESVLSDDFFVDHYDEINLPPYSCRYCGIHDPASVARCVESNKWFCNAVGAGGGRVPPRPSPRQEQVESGPAPSREPPGRYRPRVLQLRQQELLRVGIRPRQREQRRRVALSRLRRDGPGVEGHGLGVEPVASSCAGSQVPPLARQGMSRIPAGDGTGVVHFHISHSLTGIVKLRHRSRTPFRYHRISSKSAHATSRRTR